MKLTGEADDHIGQKLLSHGARTRLPQLALEHQPAFIYEFVLRVVMDLISLRLLMLDPGGEVKNDIREISRAGGPANRL